MILISNNQISNSQISNKRISDKVISNTYPKGILKDAKNRD
jgi:hypothetical protein